MASNPMVVEHIPSGGRPRTEYRAERKAIQQALEKWVPRFGLGHYRVHWELVRGIQDRENDDYIGAASVNTDQGNLHLDVKVNERFFEGPATRSVFWPGAIEATLVHELVHAVVDEHLLRELTDLIDLLPDRDEVKGMMVARMDEAHERTARVISRAIFAGEAP